MPQNWKTYKLEDALEALIDYRGKTPKKTESGVPLVTAKIVKGGRILEPNEFIAEEDYDSWMRRGIPETGDVVLTVEAPLGEVAQLKDANIALAQRIVTLRGENGKLDSTYLKYFLQSRIGQSRLEARQSGTTVFGIKQSELRKVEIDCPGFKEQTQIASILSALDDKIELNLQQNKTLEEMAMALYKHWFVDFGPFQEGEFVDSELGMIPKGWEVKSIGEITTLRYGKALKKTDRVEGVYNVYGSSGIVGTHVKSLIEGPSLIVGRKGNVGSVFWEEASSYPIDTVYYVNDLSRSELRYLFLKILNTDFKNSNSDSVVPGLNRDVAHSELLVWPKSKDFEEGIEQINDIYAQQMSNITENQTLTTLRDTLLPKLISGEVRVKDVETQLKEVL